VLAGRSAISRRELPPVGAVVIKEYRRGGMLRFIRRRYYVRRGATRPERELRNLLAARAAGLNVPEPIVSVSRGLLVYRGWLVTRLIVGRSLVDVVRSGTDGVPELVDDLTRQVGLLIDRRVAHVDLHPGNVLIDEAGTVFLLDFDRATVFSKPIEELRRQYDVRWRRAVEKHGLPAILADRFSEGLSRLSLPGA
jgi:3-deoxy-D-manno-octulosonic acid kinase